MQLQKKFLELFTKKVPKKDQNAQDDDNRDENKSNKDLFKEENLNKKSEEKE